MASTDPTERSFAAASLGTHISLEENEETKATNHVYAIKRLIRGVCSSRGGARQGFSTALTIVLTAASDEGNDAIVGEVLDRLVEETTPTGGMRGAEERDLFVGRLFGLASCARRGIKSSEDEPNVVKTVLNATRKYNSSTSEVAVRILTLLIESYGKRKWMREACVSSFNDLLNNSTEDLVLEHLLPLLAPLLQERDISSCSADELALSLLVEEHLGALMKSLKGKEKDIKLSKCVALFPSYLHPFKVDSLNTKEEKKSEESDESDSEEESTEFVYKSLLHPENVTKIAEPIKLATQSFPHIHLAWQLILNQLVDQDSNTIDMALFEPCWSVIETALIGSGTHTMKGTLLNILPVFADKLSPSHVKAVFTPKVLRLILNSTSKKDNVLCNQAKQVLAIVSGLHSSDSAWRFQVACCFMSAQADENNFNFDTRTGTKTVTTLLSDLDETSRNEYFTMLETTIFQKSEDESNFRQLSAISSLYTAVRSAMVLSEKEKDNSSDWQKRVLVFLMTVAFFDLSKLSEPLAPKSAKKARKGRSASMDESQSSLSTSAMEVALDRIRAAIKANDNHVQLAEDVRRLASTRFYSLLADQSSSGTGNGIATMIDWLGYAHQVWFHMEGTLQCKLYAPLNEEATQEVNQLRKLCGPAPQTKDVKASSKKKRKSSMDEKDESTSDGTVKTPMEQLATQPNGSSDTTIKRNQAFLILLRSSSLLLLKAPEAVAGAEEVEEEEEEKADVQEDGEDERNDIVSLLASLRECYDQMSANNKKTPKQKQEEEEEEEEEEQSLAVVAASSLSLLDVVSNSKDAMAVRGIRDCIKRSFGLILSCEEDLDTVTMNTIISAVCGDDVAEEEEEEDMSDEEELMVAEVEGEEDDDEDEEEEEDEDDDDDDNEGEVLNRIKNMASGVDGDVMLTDQADLAAVLMNDDEDEEQRAKRQQALENMLAARRLAKPTKAMRMQELRFKCQRRLRALDLLEQVAKIHPNSPHLLAAVLPLINAVRELQEDGASADAVASRSHLLPSEAKDLKQRLTTFLKNKLFKKCHPKPHPDASAEQIDAFSLSSKYTVNGLLSFLKLKCGGGDIRNTLSELCMAALSTSLYGLTLTEEQKFELLPPYVAEEGEKKDIKEGEEEEEEEEEFDERSVAINLQMLYNKYMSHKSQKTAIDRLGVNFFIEVFKYDKQLLLSALLQDLSSSIFNAKSSFLKSEALKLFVFLYSNKELKSKAQSLLASTEPMEAKNKSSKKASRKNEEEDTTEMMVNTMQSVAQSMVEGACDWLEAFSTSTSSSAETSTPSAKQQQKVVRPLLEGLMAVFSWHEGMVDNISSNVSSRLLASLQYVGETSMAQAVQQFSRKLITLLQGEAVATNKKSRSQSTRDQEESMVATTIKPSTPASKKAKTAEKGTPSNKKRQAEEEKEEEKEKTGQSEKANDKVKKAKTPKKMKK